MQVLLAILVVVIQAAGPWVRCCCVPPRLAAAVTAAPDPETPDCPHCRSAKPAASDCCQTPAGPECPTKSPQSPDCCPFSGKSVDAVPPTATDPAADVSPTVAVLPAPCRAPVLTSPIVEVVGLPFLTAQAKLYTHHVLRC